jgi:hypothetical protein
MHGMQSTSQPSTMNKSWKLKDTFLKTIPLCILISDVITHIALCTYILGFAYIVFLVPKCLASIIMTIGLAKQSNPLIYISIGLISVSITMIVYSLIDQLSMLLLGLQCVFIWIQIHQCLFALYYVMIQNQKNKQTELLPTITPIAHNDDISLELKTEPVYVPQPPMVPALVYPPQVPSYNQEALKTKYEYPLRILDQMGFTDFERNILLLENNRGNLQAVVQLLIENHPK